MIARLEGTLREKTPTRVVIDVHGVGYEVQVPLSTYGALPDEGKTVSLRIHTHVREDAMLLFGFRSASEQAVFELLIRINGVGPKLAQAILSGLAPTDLAAAVRNGDLGALHAVPGVGRKTAERIVLELRDRVATLLAEGETGPARPREAEASARLEQVLSALANLGTPRSRAEQAAREAVSELGDEESIEALIRAALRRLAR